MYLDNLGNYWQAYVLSPPAIEIDKTCTICEIKFCYLVSKLNRFGKLSISCALEYQKFGKNFGSKRQNLMKFWLRIHPAKPSSPLINRNLFETPSLLWWLRNMRTTPKDYAINESNQINIRKSRSNICYYETRQQCTTTTDPYGHLITR